MKARVGSIVALLAIVVSLASIAAACWGGSEKPKKTWQPVNTSTGGGSKSNGHKNGGSRRPSHRSHDHSHGSHPHAGNDHHHHPHPHPHLDGQDDHHHPY